MLGDQKVIASIAFSSVLLGLFIVVVAWQLSSRRKARAVLTGGTEYRQLADDYRRLSELAVTAQEHTDLRLEEVKVQLGQLREQLDSVQKILKEVEEAALPLAGSPGPLPMAASSAAACAQASAQGAAHDLCAGCVAELESGGGAVSSSLHSVASRRSFSSSDRSAYLMPWSGHSMSTGSGGEPKLDRAPQHLTLVPHSHPTSRLPATDHEPF